VYFALLYQRLVQIVIRNAQRAQCLFCFYVLGTVLSLCFGLPVLSDLTILIPSTYDARENSFLMIVDLHDLSPAYREVMKEHLEGNEGSKS